MNDEKCSLHSKQKSGTLFLETLKECGSKTASSTFHINNFYINENQNKFRKFILPCGTAFLNNFFFATKIPGVCGPPINLCVEIKMASL